MTEHTRTADLIEDFGVGWAAVHRLHNYSVEQVLRHTERRLQDDGSVSLLRNTHTDCVQDAQESAFQILLDGRRKRLESDLQGARRVRGRVQGALGWRGVLRVWPLFYRKRAKQRLAEINGIIESYESDLASLAESIEISPLPETIEHYGRLPLGSMVWVLDWDDPKNGYPLFQCEIIEEKAHLACRSALFTDRPTEFAYEMRPVGDVAREQGTLSLTVDADGLNARPRYGLSAFLDRDAAVAARQDYVDQLQSAIRKIDDAIAA